MERKMNYEIIKEINENSFICSDQHFGHLKCFEKYSPSRKEIADNFNSFEEKLIEKWNNTINDNDIVIIGGDFAINKNNKDKNIAYEKTFNNVKNAAKQLKGRKILIKGNHDSLKNEDYIKCGFELVIDRPLYLKGNNIINVEDYDYSNVRFPGSLILNIQGKNILFSHFGIKNDKEKLYRQKKYENELKLLNFLKDKFKCVLNIHGHNHELRLTHKDMFCISVEQISYTPITIKEIL